VEQGCFVRCFQEITCNISETGQDRTNVQCCYWSLSMKFDQRLWVTLKGHYVLCFKIHTFSEKKIWLKIDQYFLRRHVAAEMRVWRLRSQCLCCLQNDTHNACHSGDSINTEIEDVRWCIQRIDSTQRVFRVLLDECWWILDECGTGAGQTLKWQITQNCCYTRFWLAGFLEFQKDIINYSASFSTLNNLWC